MARFKLTPYVIRVKRKHARGDEYLALNALKDSQDNIINFLDVFKKILTIDGEVIPQSKNTWSAKTPLERPRQNAIWGVIKYGEFGLNTDFYDVQRRARTENARKDNDSEELPFFYLYHQPARPINDYGFLILLEYQKNGIKTPLQLLLEKEFSQINENLLLQIKPIISDELMGAIRNSDRIMEVKFVSHEISRDIADKCSLPMRVKIREERSFVAQTPQGFRVPAIQKILRDLRNADQAIFEISDETYNEIKVVINQGGSRRTVTFGEQEKLKEIMPLNEDNLSIRGGFPTISTILPQAQEYLNTILRKFGATEVNLE